MSVLAIIATMIVIGGIGITIMIVAIIIAAMARIAMRVAAVRAE